METIEKKDIQKAPVDGIFSGLTNEQLADIRENIAVNDPQIAEYYTLAKAKLISENGVETVHRGQILKYVHEALLGEGEIGAEKAKRLEKMVFEVKQ